MKHRHTTKVGTLLVFTLLSVCVAIRWLNDARKEDETRSTFFPFQSSMDHMRVIIIFCSSFSAGKSRNRRKRLSQRAEKESNRQNGQLQQH